MPRINPRLDPHELADLMADPEHWDLLDQVPRHPAAWPDFAEWAELTLSDPSAAGAPPEPPTGAPRKRRLRAIQPILWEEKEPETDESDKSGNSAASDSLAIAESESPDQSTASSSVSDMSEAEEVFTGDSTADETEEPPIRVRRRIPWARILALTAVIILAGVLASVTIIVGQRHVHAQALASCNQAIQQSNKLYGQWNAALDAAKPLLALGDTDVTDPEALVSLRKMAEHHVTNEIPHCAADLSTVHLEESAHTADARNKQTKTALDELSKAATAVEQSQQERRLTDAETKLSDAITQAEDLYQRAEANTDVSANETRVSLGSQLDAARNTLHTTTDITTLKSSRRPQCPHPAALRRHQTSRRNAIRASRAFRDIQITVRAHPAAAINQHHSLGASISRHPSAHTSTVSLSPIVGCAKHRLSLHLPRHFMK